MIFQKKNRSRFEDLILTGYANGHHFLTFQDAKKANSNAQGVTFEPAKKSKPSKIKKGDWSFEEIDN